MSKSGRTMLDFIMAAAEADRRGGITKEEFTRIRNHGTEDEIAEAVERMMAMGGYEALE